MRKVIVRLPEEKRPVVEPYNIVPVMTLPEKPAPPTPNRHQRRNGKRGQRR